MSNKFPALLLVFFTLFIIQITRASSITLASNGQPNATIVLASNAAENMKTAAFDLQKYIFRACGVELPLREDGATVQGCGLYIGNCEPTEAADKPDAKLNPETYSIRVRDGNIFFNANYPTPTAFAVYDFLEDDLGIRWFAPGDLWEDVPIFPKGELTVKIKDRLIIPETSPRVWAGHHFTDEWKNWNLRNKTLQSEVVPRRNFQNYMHLTLPPSKYAAEHPEYYPLIDGKRYIPSGRLWRPCESNPEVQKIIIEHIRTRFNWNPKLDSFSLGMDDIEAMCSCENCRAMDAHPDDYENGKFSNRHYKFVNIIAKAVAETHPDRFIGTLIYNVARELPETVPVLEPNVFGYITETSAAWWMEGQKEKDNELTREWRKRCQHLSRYDYYGFSSLAPRYYPTYVDQQMKLDKELGFEGLFAEIYTFLPLTMPMIWQLAKLQWDHTLNSEDILAEFRRKMYGSAEPHMTAFWDLLEKTYQKQRPGRGAWEWRNIKNMAYATDLEDCAKAMDLLDRATTATADEKVKARIDIHRGALQLTSYAIKPHYLSLEIEKLKVENRQEADQAIAAAEQIAAWAEEREAHLEKLEKRQDLLGENFRVLPIPVGNFRVLEFGVVSAFFRALDWYQKFAPQELPVLESKLQNSLKGNKMLAAYLKKSAMTEKPKNLLVNGNFERRKANQKTAKIQSDWQSEGAPFGWNTWSSVHNVTYEVKAGEGRNGSAAAIIKDSHGSAVYLQAVKVKAGDKLLCTGWMRGTGPGTVSYGFRLQNEKGRWIRMDLQGSLNMEADEAKDWQPVAFYLEAPEDCDKVIIMLSTKNQKEDSCVWFDDLEVIKM